MKISKSLINKIKKKLENNSVIIYPSESMYGFGCKFDSLEAINKIYKIKSRDYNKKFIVLVSSFEMAKALVYIDKKQEEFLKKYWPGHLSVIFDSKTGDSLALRYPKDEFLNTLLNECNFPIISTSVNFSGHEDIKDINEIKKLFKDSVDMIVDIPPHKPGIASSVIDLRNKEIKIIRQGSVVIKDL